MNPQIQQLIGQAIERFQSGSPKQAEEILMRVLSMQSNNLPALEILGLIKASTGEHLEAAKLLKKAIKLNPSNPATQYNLAKALSESKDYVGSLIHHEKALQLAPNNPDGWLNYGQTLAVLKRHEQALTAFDKALSLQPQYAEAWHNKALTLSELKRHEEAIDCFNKGIALQPNNPKEWLDLSCSLGALKRYQEALQACDQALALQPNYLEAWLNKGSAYTELKEYRSALDCYDQALLLKDNYVDAWYSKGVALEKLEQQEEALLCYNKAIELDSNFSRAWLNKGCILNDMAHYEEAIACFNRAIDLDTNYADAWANKAIALYELRKYEEAISCCDKAIEIEPDHVDGHWNKAFAQLILGKFEEGWPNYEYRWKRNGAETDPYPHIPRVGSLEELTGKSLIVWPEQGFGDILQFARYIPKLIQLEIQVFFEVPSSLISLFKNHYSCNLIPKNEHMVKADFQTPLASLPLLFKTTLNTIPSDVPYIQVSSEIIEKWAHKLPLSKDMLNIGIACSGNIHFDLKHGANKRPIPLSHFHDLATRHNIFLIQKDVRKADQVILETAKNIHPLGDLINSFEDTAAIIENMDLIISIDTSLAHLAGAMGKKILLLLPWSPDWRYLTHGSTSPWYPSATLIRQPNPRDWKSVMKELEKILNLDLMK